VFSATPVSHAPVTPVCDNSPPFTLFGGNPGGGTYSGNGVNGGQFLPNVTGIGFHTVNYTYTNIYGCVSDTSFLVEVRGKPNVQLDTFPWICASDPAYTLIEGTPVGGVTGPGFFPVTYLYTDSVGCSNSKTKNFRVRINPPKPIITITNGILLCNWGFYMYQWYLNGVPIPGADSIVYTPTVEGNYTVELIDKYGCTNISDPFYALSVEQWIRQDLLVFPNPATSYLNLKSDAGIIRRWSLHNAVGATVIEGDASADPYMQSIDIGALAPGLYTLRVHTPNGEFGEKIVIPR
jgi:hypothetical protein